MFPDTYDSPLHLPFNQNCLEGQFEFLLPDGDPDGSGYWIMIHGGEIALIEDDGSLILPSGELSAGISSTDILYIGQWQKQPCRVVTIDHPSELPESFHLHGMASPLLQTSIELLSLFGLARQISHWHENSRFCASCGQQQQWLAGEWGKICKHCSRHHFPHIHPCVIVVVRRPGEILMARKADWPEGRYSLVAGFLDMGECLEEAVAREVKEETGLQVENIRYIGSQSWPFPSQLMTGFTADYAGGEIVIEEAELEDVRWFPVDDLPVLPPNRSISRYLIDNYKE